MRWHIARRWLFDLTSPRSTARISGKDILTAAIWAGADRDKDGKIVWASGRGEIRQRLRALLRDGQAPIPGFRNCSGSLPSG
jgi:hypothetical protein